MMRKLFLAAIAINLGWMPACATESPGDRKQTNDDPWAPSAPYPTPNPGFGTNPANEVAMFSSMLHGRRLHSTELAGFVGTADAGVETTWAAAKAELPGVLGSFDLTNFDIVSHETSTTLSGARLVHLSMRQKVGDVLIDGTYLHLTSRAADRVAPARLLSSSYLLFARPPAETAPEISRESAAATARERLRVGPYARIVQQELVMHELDNGLELVWKITAEGSHYRAYVVARGDRRGAVHVEDARVYEASGTVSGTHVRQGAPGGQGLPVAAGLPNLAVTTAGGAVAITDGDGGFTLDVPDGEPVIARLAGVAANVSDFFGDDLLTSAPAAPGLALELGSPASSEGEIAQTTAYVFTDHTRSYLEVNGIPGALLGAPLSVNVNLPDTCNAFYSPTARSINFFASGGPCNNTAIDTVIAHEYGHFADDVAGDITNGGLSEGWGDLLACYSLDTPFTGEDFFVDGGFVRACENDYVFPPSGNDEVHQLGQAWAGFAWRVREGLQAQLGDDQGDAMARDLILPSLVSNAPDIQSAVLEAFLRDDDDGDLTNETPHWDILFAAAEHHGLGFVVNQDLNAPDPVTDLQVEATGATTATLTWTATGDDGSEGTASLYDIRFSLEPIDASNFFAATPVPAPPPAPAGTPEKVDVTVLPASTVFFAMIVQDENANLSALSNVVEVTTSEGQVVLSEGAENGQGGWTATGMWHITGRRAATGAHAFWYGQEATGDYDDGTANAGDLLSPVIGLAGVESPILSFFELIEVEAGNDFDLIEVTVFDADDPSKSLFFPKEKANTAGSFVPRMLPIASFAGANIQIRFHFDTIDGIANDFEGWYIDDIRIIGTGTGATCAHAPCDVGEPLDPTCDTCVETVCAADALCCSSTWDSLCVLEAMDLCALTCDSCGDGICEPGEDCSTCPEDCGACPVCEHDPCEAGAPLDPQCDECATTVCEQDSFCCDVLWDRLCIQQAESLCGLQCDASCNHDTCSVGDPLAPSCDTCTDTVCALDPYCCETAWDGRCVAAAAQSCDITCETCLHEVCEAGQPLAASCDPCVAAVCAEDAFCCTTSWDDRCVGRAGQLCGIECPVFRP